MPQLPSGRHVALDPSPLQDLVSSAYSKISTHELMEIESTNQLFSYINILYFLPKDNNSKLSLATFSMGLPEGLAPYYSGFNLVTIKNEMNNWVEKDKKAFISFLNETRTNLFLENILQTIQKYQNELMEHPHSLQGMLAQWWKLGIHPLQEDEK